MSRIRRSDRVARPPGTLTRPRPSTAVPGPDQQLADGGSLDAHGWWFSAAALRCLDRDPAPRVTMIAAPAGSGKSRLVEHWLARSPQRRWVWLTFDPPDRSEPEQVIAAIDGAGSEASSAEGGPGSGKAGAAPAVLVVQGLEVLAAEQQVRLLDRLPAGLRVVLLSTGLGLPSSCLVRLAGDLAELRPAQLWWPAGRIAAGLAALAGIEIDDREAGELHRLTGGWPAGVLILGRARRRPAAQREGAAPELAAETAETADPFDPPEDDGVLDFLTTQVLDRLEPAVRRFVLRTSVLAELDPGRCRALVPDTNPDAALAELHRQGLTEPPDQPGPGSSGAPARYQRLIRAAALRALRREHAGAEAELLGTAGEHARAAGHPVIAMAGFVAARQWDQALAVLASSAPEGFRGWPPPVLQRSLTRLPERTWAADAEHRALVAFAAAISGDQLLAAEIIQQTPDSLTAPAPWWPALTLTIRALGVKPPGGPRGAGRVASAALAEIAVLDDAGLPAMLGVNDRPGLEALAHLLAARAALFDGDPAGVRRQLAAGWGSEGGELPRYAVLAGLGTDALASAWDGSLAAAQRRAERARRLAEQAGLLGHPLIGLTLLATVEVLRARGRIDQALAELDAVAPVLRANEGFVAAASGGQFHTAAERILRATLLLDRADPPAAAAELDRLAGSGDDDLPVALESARAVAWARLHLARGDVAAAELVLRAAPATGPVAGLRVTVALQRQAPDEARAVIQNWPAQEAPDNRLRRLLASAALDLAVDRRPEAGRQIDEALAEAEPDGHVQVFLEAPPAARVLTAVVLRRQSAGSPWRQELARRLDEIRLVTDSGSVPITRRELAVLERLTTALTHAQIAAEMFVSENTLKSHCRNLYRKLGVNSRADAVRAARARGWLVPSPGSIPDPSAEGDVVLDVNITPEPAVVEL